MVTSNLSVEKDMKDVECVKCHKKRHYANKCTEIKAKDAKGSFKVRKVDDSSVKEDGEAKVIRQIRIRYSDLNAEREDPFMRYWIILSNLGQVRIGDHNERHLSKIFVDTGANCNTISRKFYRTLVDQRFEVCAYSKTLRRFIDQSGRWTDFRCHWD